MRIMAAIVLFSCSASFLDAFHVAGERLSLTISPNCLGGPVMWLNIPRVAKIVQFFSIPLSRCRANSYRN